jgi:hypothetical protein
MARTGRSTSSTARGPRERAHDAATVRITSASSSHSERIHGRQVRYLVSMAVRTACFVLAVVTDGTLRWLFIAGAVVLPYIAVVVANAGGEVDDDAPQPFVDDSRLMLGPGPAADGAKPPKSPA